MARNDHSSTRCWEVNSRMSDPPRQDPIRRAIVAERQRIRQQRKLLRVAHEARSNQQLNDVYRGTEGRRLYN